MDNSRLLNNKTTLVTGGTSGIGFYTAVALARMGAAVYITRKNLGTGNFIGSRSTDGNSL